jgi:7-cyano-7-deazaguanine synthase
MIVNQAVVLLSGGMDSCAALCWARGQYKSLLAIMFDYGQSNRDQELSAAGRLCEELGVENLSLVTGDTIPRGLGILGKTIPDHDGRDDGTSPNVVPNRNGILANSAAAHAARYFPNGNLALVLGCNMQDAKRYPDCHPASLTRLTEALRHTVAREIQVVVPWIDRTKTQILQALGAEDRAHVARSWSCYRGDGPCHRCSACALREEAFAAVGLLDQSVAVALSGGDPARDAKLSSAMGPPIPIRHLPIVGASEVPDDDRLGG